MAGNSRSYSLFETPFGWCGVAWSERGLTHLQLPEGSREATERRLRGPVSTIGPTELPSFVGDAVLSVQQYLAGQRVEFASVCLDLEGVSPFYRAVYEAALSIGWGSTTTYGALARLAGVPGAARAVGQALSRNPIPVIIPCHRILASGDRSGGFSAFGGISMKRRLLELEGVCLGRAAGDGQLTLSGGLDV